MKCSRVFKQLVTVDVFIKTRYLAAVRLLMKAVVMFTLWNQKRVLLLIQELRKRPALWDVRNEQYRNQKKRKLLISNISKILRVDERKIKEKIGCLRAQFSRIYQKVKSSKLRGKGNEYIPTWFGYKPLLFIAENTIKELHPKKGVRKCKRLVLDKELDERCENIADDIEILGDSSCDFHTFARNSKMLKGNLISESFNMVKEPRKKLKMQSLRDEYAIYGEHVGNQLRNTDDECAEAIARFKIDEILYKLAMGEYCRENHASSFFHMNMEEFPVSPASFTVSSHGDQSPDTFSQPVNDNDQ